MNKNPLEKDEIYRLIFNCGPDPIILLDIDTRRHLDVNTPALELYGYDQEEFLALCPTDLSAEFEEMIKKTGRKEAKELFTELSVQYHQKKDGTRFPVEISTRPFLLNGKRTLCAAIRDITDRKRTEDSMKQNKHRLDLIVNSFNGFIYTVSKDYKIEFINNSLTDYIGYDATGQNCFQLIHGLNQICPWCCGESVLSGKTRSFERISPKDNRWYYYVSTPRIDSDGTISAQQIIAIDIHDRKEMEVTLKKSTQHLQQENRALRSAAIHPYGFYNIVGQSRQMQEIYDLILEVASSDASILIHGESGSGKELVAKAIHDLGKRKDNVFLPVNCGGIPENLIESEFFGYKKGAFTGATFDKSGFLRISDEGTLFLDEIGEISLNMQVKLLRALDGDGYTPLGSSVPLKPNVRIVSATNKDLNELINKGLMRSDFFYRINVIPLHLPPLRKRKEDIALLIYHFLKKFSSGKPIPHIPPAIMNALENYDWPGNIRELQNIIHRYVALKRIEVFDSFIPGKNDNRPFQEIELPLKSQISNLDDAVQHYEKSIISLYLKNNQWKQGKVASMLGVNRKTLYYKIKKHGIEKV